MKKYTLFLVSLILSVIFVNAKTSNNQDKVNFTPNQDARKQASLTLSGLFNTPKTSDIVIVPITISCETPSGLTASSITDVTAKLSWTAVSGALSYNIQYRVKGASSWLTVNTTSNSYTLTKLTELTRYECQVQTVCNLGSSGFSTSYLFTTLAAASCGTPTNISVSSITDVSATIDWTAVSGATSYYIQYREIGAATWLLDKTTSASFVVNGLTEMTRYEFQVQTVCTSGISSFSELNTFTTAAASTICPDNYEPNNTIATAASIPVNTSITASISSTADVDCFKFSNNIKQRNIKVMLTNLPGDYDIRLYKSDGTLISTSQNADNTDEAIIYNNAPFGTYYVKVYSHSGYYTAGNCYTLDVKISSSKFKAGSERAKEINEADTPLSISIFPNPANNQTTISYNIDEDKTITIKLYDITGRTISSNEYTANKGLNNYTLDLSKVIKGLYIVELSDGSNVIVRKLFVDK